jgi:membrane protein implicated in regulation of membrane protease activity
VALLVAFVIALVWLEAPWSLLLVGAALVLEIGEAWLWWRWSRRRKPAIGVEAMIGSSATVISPTQVRIHGELWGARSDESLEPGDQVEVVAVDGLTLVVARP